MAENTMWHSLKEVFDGVKEILEEIEKGGKVASGEPIVLDQSIFDKVAAERKLISDLSFSDVPEVDPWADGVSVAVLTGVDLRESLEAATAMQNAYDKIDANIGKLTNELTASNSLLRSFQSQTVGVEQLYKLVDDHLEALSALDNEVPYWWLEMDNLQLAMRARDNELSDKITSGNAKLKAATEFRKENEIRRKDVDRWVKKIIDSQIDEERRKLFDRIYGQIKQLAGPAAGDIDVKMLSGILTAMMANDEKVKEAATAMRADAERIRSQTRVGKGLFDLLLGLAAIGAGTMNNENGATDVPDDASGPNNILIESEEHPLMEYRPEPETLPLPLRPLR
ncbi:hypothetical protein B5K05_18630 [Rhizobium phaseoli]|uniref:hypothetical protein n=1 Tax=Rhizobium phaseoli TaxID=396 RepID=UPI0006346F8C|nr:hypothetical protein [Rhizobium phaseoli]KKZ86478.1 hypothetical protein RPHASCH2410_CH15225 [Rhizobium phaseoli Ch24-10]RDJ07607.1 hypothetical protein B5K04_18590 [Rhizobium phaseoli]RDJ09912.1 hypothetical protein B5K05_18630 [Rhizobium phaseoli]